MQSGPVRSVVRINGSIPKLGKFSSKVFIYNDITQIDFETYFTFSKDSLIIGKMLNAPSALSVDFTPAVSLNSTEWWRNLPFATIEVLEKPEEPI